VKNEDARSEAYNEMKDKFRPSHADFTYDAKYGARDPRGALHLAGGRPIFRSPLLRSAAVIAGALARRLPPLPAGEDPPLPTRGDSLGDGQERLTATRPVREVPNVDPLGDSAGGVRWP